MKVQEVRTIIKDYDRTVLENIIVELYKNIPKYKKERDGVDTYLQDAAKTKKVEKNKGELIFEELASEIETFISNVQEGYYSQPNKFVSKEQRTKWRFKVKNYYKILSNMPPDSEDGGMATKLLVDIYKWLSRGTYYRMFSNFETFRSIGVMQTAYFNMLADRILCKNSTDGAVRILVSLIAVSIDSSWFEEDDLKKCFIGRLKKDSLYSKACEQMKTLVVDELVPTRTERAKVANVYYYDDIIDNLTECYARCCFEIDQLEEGIDFFMNYYEQKYQTHRVYDLLKLLLEYKYYDKWMELYKMYEKDLKNMRVEEDYESVKKHLSITVSK